VLKLGADRGLNVGSEQSVLRPLSSACRRRSTATSSSPAAPATTTCLESVGPAALDATDVGEQLGMVLDVEAERQRAATRAAGGRSGVPKA
jgi:hypothetical protein